MKIRGLGLGAYFFFLASGLTAHAQDKTLCGADDREPSDLKPIARMMKTEAAKAGCTGTLFSASCMVSAGHCVSHLKFAQFNVPASDSTGRVRSPSAVDQYVVEKVIRHSYDGPGKDWSVYRLLPNAITGRKAGDVQGSFDFNIFPLSVAQDQAVRITGYGSDTQPERNYAQQTSLGKIEKFSNAIMSYFVDTEGGNSGSAIILESTQEIVGIHTHGACSKTGASGNKGTSLAESPEFQQAMLECLALE